MSTFLSGEHLLQTAVMLGEGLPDEAAILIVEGDTDKNFFRRLCRDPGQILVADGKSFLMDAHAAMRRQDRGKVVFVVDCDGDVQAGRLSPAPDLIVSQFNDAEADLIASGVLTMIVPELVKGAANLGLDELSALAVEIRNNAAALAMPVGRIRRAARIRGITLRDLNEVRFKIDFASFRSEDGSVDFERALTEVVRLGSLGQVQAQRIRQTVGQVAGGYQVCNGHDLVYAIGRVLRHDHGVASRKVENLDSLFRTATHPGSCAKLGIIRRLRAWQEAHGRHLLIES